MPKKGHRRHDQRGRPAAGHLTDPLHRQIIENYSRHAILEVTGEWEGIFATDMTVASPEYFFNVKQFDGVRVVGDGVKAVYNAFADNANAVSVVEDEQLALADSGFASNAMFNTYHRGTELNKVGPEGYYILRQHFASR